jgi:O-antigen/teichoic acid export membrane protein
MLAAAGIMSVAKLASEACIFVFFVLISRAYGPEGLGRYSLATAVGSLLFLSALGGTHTLNLKEVPRHGAGMAGYLERMLGLRLLLALLASIALAVSAAWPWLSAGDRQLWWLVGSFQVLSALVVGSSAVLLALGRTLQAGLPEVMQKLLIALGGGALVMWGMALEATAVALPVASVIVAVIAIRMERRASGARAMRFDPVFIREKARSARPYLVVELLDQVARRTDIVLIGILLGAAATGEFNAAYRIRFLLGLLMSQVRNAMLPAISRSAFDSPEQLPRRFHNTVGAIFLLAVPAGAGLAVLSGEVIQTIYSVGYEDSALLLAVLAASIPPLFLRQVGSVFLQAMGREAYWGRSSRIVAVFAIASGALGIWLFGTLGAAVAILLSECLSVVLFVSPLVRNFGWRPSLDRLLISLAGALAMALVLIVLPPVALVLEVAVGAAVYTLVVLAFPDVRRLEVTAVQEALRRRG